MAALLVVISHAASFVFVQYGEVLSPNFITKFFYFISGLGHESVMIFFVLSGFLIGRSILLKSENWSWLEYVINRVARLWVVLVPALILTYFWDTLGIIITDSGYYIGEYRNTYNSGPELVENYEGYGFLVFLSNLFFLQTVLTDTYGSNGPLWSLANEFWYYVLFPLGYFSVVGSGRSRAFNFLIFTCVFSFLIYYSPSIIAYWAVWIFGVLVYTSSLHTRLQPLFKSKIYFVLAIVFFATCICLARLRMFDLLLSDFIVSISFSFLLSVLIFKDAKKAVYINISRFFSNISYSLYLTHFPIFGFLCSFFLKNNKLQFEFGSVLFFIFMNISAIFFAYVFFYLFESQTSKVRMIATNMLVKAK